MAKGRLEFTAAAETDLEAIGDYIALDNPAAALRFVLSIREHCKRIASNPGLGRVRPEFATGLRSVALSPYVIFYRVTDSERVTVVRIVHGARDVPQALKS